MVHVDLSGCNLGSNVLLLAPALFKSLTLLSIHLHQNNIPADAREELLSIFRVRLESRMNKSELQIEAKKMIMGSSDCTEVDVSEFEEKLARLKKEQMRQEAK